MHYFDLTAPFTTLFPPVSSKMLDYYRLWHMGPYEAIRDVIRERAVSRKRISLLETEYTYTPADAKLALAVDKYMLARYTELSEIAKWSDAVEHIEQSAMALWWQSRDKVGCFLKYWYENSVPRRIVPFDEMDEEQHYLLFSAYTDYRKANRLTPAIQRRIWDI